MPRLLLLSLLCRALALPGAPIWTSNATSSFALLRAPDFALRAPPLSATLFFTALGSPGTQGTLQAKLLGAACPHLNGVLLTCGPGHATPTAAQLVRSVSALPFLRSAGANALGIAAFYNQRTARPAQAPRVQAWLEVTDAAGAYTVAATGQDWRAPANADAVFGPTGNAGVAWYYFPNENLNRSAYPVGWALPGFAAAPWPPAALAPPFPAPLYLDAAAVAPTALQRHACAVTTLGPGHQLLDYGQEFMGGVNLTFPAAPAGATVSVTLGETLLPTGGVRSPLYTGNRWNSTWTLAGSAQADAGIVQHEFIQFRYAEVVQTPAASAHAFTPATALAWVLQHPAGGDGRNPWELPCATSVPAAALWGAGAPPATPLGAFSSSLPALDAVFNFSAYTMLATALDVNVDGQTRERDVDLVDSLINARGQYALFSPGDTSIAERTLLEALTNDTGMWSQWYDFKASTVLYARDHALYTGSLGPLRAAYCNTSQCIAVPPALAFNSLQFLSGYEYYYNASGSGLMSFPADGSCRGRWSCEVLLDWPTSTRDGYDASAANNEDTARSALGAMALGALGDAAAWVLGEGSGDAAAYAAASAGVRAALVRHNLRVSPGNGTAYFVDGRTGGAARHAAVHSTLLACAAGACDGLNASVSAGLVAFLSRHGVPPSSCMMGRWWVEALYRLGIASAAGADAALAVLTAPDYPGWLDMLAQGATCTMEAWRPADKGNLDFAHPWCASPAFTIVAGTVGAAPLAPAWARWRLAPQPSALTALAARIPTPSGMVPVAYAGAVVAGVSANATVSVTVAPAQSLQACLAMPGAASDALPSPAQDGLTVDGVAEAGVAWGRFLCAQGDLGPGPHVITRFTRA